MRCLLDGLADKEKQPCIQLIECILYLIITIMSGVITCTQWGKQQREPAINETAEQSCDASRRMA